jgi:hypothetical protein
MDQDGSRSSPVVANAAANVRTLAAASADQREDNQPAVAIWIARCRLPVARRLFLRIPNPSERLVNSWRFEAIG